MIRNILKWRGEIGTYLTPIRQIIHMIKGKPKKWIKYNELGLKGQRTGTRCKALIDETFVLRVRINSGDI
jgi:hypothetical protein